MRGLRSGIRLGGGCFLGLALTLTAPFAAAMQAEEPEVVERDAASKLRLLPVTIDSKGMADVETVALQKDISRVVFYLDDEEVAKRRKVPFAVKIPVAQDRQQQLTAKAFDRNDKLLGTDSVTVGRQARPLRLRIAEAVLPAQGASADTSVKLTLDISAPEPELLSALEVSIDGQTVARRASGEFVLGRLELDVIPAEGQRFTRGSVLVATLKLSDGRTLDDALPLGEAVFREELDVRLMQLQLVVLDRGGNPIAGLSEADFAVKENGRVVEVERVFPAPDISLLLGLSIDSSGSMLRLWDQTKAASEQFLQQVLSPRDSAFLVDFDVDLRLVTETTDDLDELRAGLDAIQPEGGTALYDSIVFSLLQFERRPGRRGLVLITDGVDAGSLTDPKRTIDLARRFGVPVYLIALQHRGSQPGMGGGGGRELQARVQTLRLLTDPSGGRLFRAGSMEGVAAALEQIETELRSQYVLTYYTDEEIDWRKPPKIEVKIPGRKGVEIKTIFGVDLVE